MIQFFIVKFERVPFANSSKFLWCQMKRQSISIIAIVAIVAIVPIAIVPVAIIPIAVGGSGGCWLCSCRPGGSCPSRGARALPTCDQVLDPGQVVLDSSVDPRRGRGAPHAIAHHPNQCVFTVLWNSKSFIFACSSRMLPSDSDSSLLLSSELASSFTMDSF